MSDEIHPAHRAPQPAVEPAPAPVPAPVPLTEATHQTSSPTTATHQTSKPTIATHQTSSPTIATHNNAAQPTTFPAANPYATTVPPPAAHNATTEEPLNLNAKLNQADRYWKFKGVFQIITILSGLIGIGTIGWVMSTNPKKGFYFGYDNTELLWPGLITFAISIIWCLACILVLLHKKRPMHAGLRVAMDLLLWLGLITTALFALLSLTNMMAWGTYGDLDGVYYSFSGDYRLANNGTWVWQRDSDYETNRRDCNGTPYVGSYYGTSFANCAEQDAYVNMLWQEKDHRTSVEFVAVVCQFLSMVLHLVLFIWACVDCYKYNHSKVSQDAEKLAANIIQTMIENGAIVPPPGQAHMRPIPWGQPGHYQLSYQQMYPMYPQAAPPGQPAPQQYGAPMMQEQPPTLPPRPVVAGPVNEKSEGPRYA